MLWESSPYHHHIPVPLCQQIDQIALKLVSILIFIHQNELELPLVLLRGARSAPSEA